MKNKTKAWFGVHVPGLRQLLGGRDSAFILTEPLQNAWDEEGTTSVEVELLSEGKRTGIRVTDDNPEGFKDLDESFTLFAPSRKKGNPEQRGRFNLGEKLVLACCDEATITSTTGRMIFDKDGRRRSRVTRITGTCVEGWLVPGITTAAKLRESAMRLIPPPNIKTLVDGIEIVPPKEIGTYRVSLSTPIANANGELKNGPRMTNVTLYESFEQEGLLLEMGIPVCPSGAPFSINVRQKIPLGFDRESTSESYHQAVRGAALNVAVEIMTPEEAKRSWVTRALDHPNCTAETAKKVIRLRFGERVATWDPSDPEANASATAHGYTVLTGGTFGAPTWDKLRETDAAPPSGQVFPTPRAFYQDGTPLKTVPMNEWGPGLAVTLARIRTIVERVLEHSIEIVLADDRDWRPIAAYGPSGTLYLNAAKIAHMLTLPLNVKMLDLLIHEMGHERCGNHLSEDYYDALTHYGARLALLLREEPHLSDR
jgi:hypothetical protein